MVEGRGGSACWRHAGGATVVRCGALRWLKAAKCSRGGRGPAPPRAAAGPRTYLRRRQRLLRQLLPLPRERLHRVLPPAAQQHEHQALRRAGARRGGAAAVLVSPSVCGTLPHARPSAAEARVRHRTHQSVRRVCEVRLLDARLQACWRMRASRAAARAPQRGGAALRCCTPRSAAPRTCTGFGSSTSSTCGGVGQARAAHARAPVQLMDRTWRSQHGTPVAPPAEPPARGAGARRTSSHTWGGASPAAPVSAFLVSSSAAQGRLDVMRAEKLEARLTHSCERFFGGVQGGQRGHHAGLALWRGRSNNQQPCCHALERAHTQTTHAHKHTHMHVRTHARNQAHGRARTRLISSQRGAPAAAPRRWRWCRRTPRRVTRWRHSSTNPSRSISMARVSRKLRAGAAGHVRIRSCRS